eukprot:scaffold133633_cov37-Tisochrysis_lutea.AAC.2
MHRARGRSEARGRVVRSHLQSAGAESVDCLARDADWAVCPHGSIARNIHPRLSLRHPTAHHHVLNERGLKIRLFESGGDRVAAQSGAVSGVEATTEGFGEAGAC